MGSIKAKQIKVEFALSNDIDKFLDIANNNLSDYNDLQKQSEVKSVIAGNAAKQAIALSEKAIAQSKELGVDDSFFKGRLQMSKDALSRSSKGKANIL